jgi:ubiquinone/menaquinone biosynthesis C-methylase UbiE
MLNGWRYDLLADVRGSVLEIGVRSAPNFRFYGPDTKVVATDIDINAMYNARRIRWRFSPRIVLSLADAQRLPFATASFDAVVATLVFCSIPDPSQAFKEVARVLKPDGRFYSIEHVRGEPPLLGKAMDFLTPAWKACSGGCNLNRHTESVLRSSGFEIVERRAALAGVMRYLIAAPPA